jgi:raffinose/stachyose/melibiose transport system substrate-binding protein
MFRETELKRLVKLAVVAVVLFGLAVLLFHDKQSVSKARSENRLEIYYMYNEGELQADWFGEAVKRFQAMHPGLEIDVLYAGREVLGKLRPRMIIGNPPDIVNQGGDALRPLMRDGLFEELDTVLTESAYGQDMAWRDTFIPGLLDIFKYEGHYYQVPGGLFCTVFFYNVEQFEKLHLAPPRTWSEFLSVCQALKDNGIEPIAADGTEIGYNVMWYGSLMGRMTNIPHIQATVTNEAGTSWLEKPYAEAAKKVRELSDKGYIMKGYQGSKWPSAQMLWVQGKCGLLLCGTWIPKEMKNKLPEGFRMGIFRFPTVEGYPDGGALNQDINSECFAVPKGARHRETAIEFLKFITSKEESKYLADMDVPCGTKGVPEPASLAGLDEILNPPYVLVETISGITSDYSEWYRNVARNSWSDLFLGHVEPQAMCEEVEAAHKRFYEREKLLDKGKGQ